MRIILLLGFVFSFSITIAQVNITGRVLSDVSGEPLSKASVYINNSTIGTTTDEEGRFQLQHVRPGKYDLIITYVSYEVLLHTILVVDKDLKYEFRLSPKEQQMRNIIVMSNEKRREMMKLFKSQFLGITLAAENSKILNENEVMFEAGNSLDEFKAFAENPLVIINKELGYKISFDLQEFFINTKTGRTMFYGYTRYEELDSGNTEKWTRRRRAVYLGSTMHFFHSMYQGTAEANNFRIYRIFKDSVRHIVARSAKPVNPSTLVFTDSVSGQKYMQWDGSIVVQYLKDPVYKADLMRKVILNNASVKGVESNLDMLAAPAWFTESGLLDNPLAVQYSGYWSYEKLANMLPVNYSPPNIP